MKYFKCILILVLTWATVAQARVSLPLQGYCRAGRCMPVRIEQTPGSVKLDGQGIAVTNALSGRWGIVPLLVVSDTPGPLRVEAEEIPLRSLAGNDRLIGIASKDEHLPAELFAGQNLIKVHLDPANPIPGPPMAWETLDAIVLDSPIDPQHIVEYLDSGMAVIVRTTNVPDSTWPWKKIDNGWLLQIAPSGPTSALVGESGYVPAQNWAPGLDSDIRIQIVLAAIVAMLLLTAMTLLRRWYYAMPAMCIACWAVIFYWRQNQPDLREVGGTITFSTATFQQRDRWRYVQSPHDSFGESALDRPMLVDSVFADEIQLSLYCRADGGNVWRYVLPHNTVLGLMDRVITPAKELPPMIDSSVSPLSDLARQIYLKPSTRLLGQTASAPNQWPGVVVGQ